MTEHRMRYCCEGEYREQACDIEPFCAVCFETWPCSTASCQETE